MSTISWSRAVNLQAKALFDMADRGTVVVTRNRMPLCAVFALRGQDWERFVVSHSPVFRRILARARRARSKGESVSLEQVKRRYGIK